MNIALPVPSSILGSRIVLILSSGRTENFRVLAWKKGMYYPSGASLN